MHTISSFLKNFFLKYGAAFAGLWLTHPAVAADTRFGAMTHFAQGWDTSLAGKVAGGGITQVRDELYWSQIESKKGVYQFPATFDNYMAALSQQGISPLIVLDFENPLYDNNNTPYTAEAFKAYAAYAVQVLRHYGKQIKTVEIWNEYNGGFCRGPAADDRATNYLAMLKVAYKAIKAERPDVIVLAGGTAGVPLPYWEKLLAGGVLSYADGLSIHPYRYTLRPEGIEDDVVEFKKLVASYGTPKPIWVTEIGWQLKASTGADDFAIDESIQAKFLVRAYALLMSAGVENIYWYLARDYQDFTMGLMRGDGTPKPAYAAMATFVKQMQGTTFVRRETTAEGLYSLLFRTPSGADRRVIWATTQMPVTLKGATAAVDINGKAVSRTTAQTVFTSPLFVTGPLTGLPTSPAPKPIIADSVRDFSLKSGSSWSYGYYLVGTMVFTVLPNYLVTDWRAEWTTNGKFISITAYDQHPTYSGLQPISVVRRWRSDKTQKIRITGSFQWSNSGGDGVGVSVYKDSALNFRTLLSASTSAVKKFDFVLNVVAGTTIDFVVDPGPAAKVQYDSTLVNVVIRKEP